MSIASTTVSLLWNSVSSWGTACSGANNQYKLYLGTTNPPSLYATYDSSTLSTNYLGTKGSTYYWYVQASNGQLTTSSTTRSFTILNDQITGQVFYDRANSCGGSGWSTGGVAVSLDGGVGNAIAADGSFNLTASTLSSHTLEVSIPVGYVCSTVSGCNSCSRIGIASPSANNNFYLTDLLEPWWQAAGAGVYAGGLGGGVTVRSQLPTAETSLILPGTTGSVGALLRASGSVGVGNGRVSDEGYSTMARYRGKKMDYNFFAAQMGVVRGQDSEFMSDNLILPVYDPDRDFWYSAPFSGTATIGDPWVIGVGEKYVIFVNGDLRIANDIQVASGGFLALIANGDIIIEPEVTQVQGIYVASANFVTESQYKLGVTNDVPLEMQGSMVAWGTMSLGRNLGTGNNTTPAEQFNYRLDLLTNMPSKMKTYVMQWQEVAAGTFGD